MTTTIPTLEIIGKITPEYAQILTPEALRFVAAPLIHKFLIRPVWSSWPAGRKDRLEINAGKVPTFLDETQDYSRCRLESSRLP